MSFDTFIEELNLYKLDVQHQIDRFAESVKKHPYDALLHNLDERVEMAAKHHVLSIVLKAVMNRIQTLDKLRAIVLEEIERMGRNGPEFRLTLAEKLHTQELIYWYNVLEMVDRHIKIT